MAVVTTITKADNDNDDQVRQEISEHRTALLHAMTAFKNKSTAAWRRTHLVELQATIERIETDEDHHFLSYLPTEMGKVSYASKLAYKYDNEHRTRTTLGRYLRKQLGMDCAEFSDAHVESLTHGVFEYLAKPVPSSITILDGKAIMQAYADEVGCHTCMTGENANQTVLYAVNPDKVKLAAYNDSKEEARALLWTTDEGITFLDRVYPCTGYNTSALHNWAQDNGWAWREELGKVYNCKPKYLHVTLKIADRCPYMDTFVYCKHKQDSPVMIVSNNPNDNQFILQDTDVDVNPWDAGYDRECCECGYAPGADEDVCRSQEGEIFCAGCYEDIFVRCGRCSREVDKDDAYSITDRCSELWCTRCTEHYAKECSTCCELYEEGVTECADGQYRCGKCKKQWQVNQRRKKGTQATGITHASH